MFSSTLDSLEESRHPQHLAFCGSFGDNLHKGLTDQKPARDAPQYYLRMAPYDELQTPQREHYLREISRKVIPPKISGVHV
jgi:hypothetical protein